MPSEERLSLHLASSSWFPSALCLVTALPARAGHRTARGQGTEDPAGDVYPKFSTHACSALPYAPHAWAFPCTGCHWLLCQGSVSRMPNSSGGPCLRQGCLVAERLMECQNMGLPTTLNHSFWPGKEQKNEYEMKYSKLYIATYIKTK